MNENNKFHWSDLSVNNENIDNQHKHIFNILDHLNMLSSEASKKASLHFF